MQYNLFHNKKEPVSRFGMGCMRLPQKKAEDGNSEIDQEESIRMIHHAIEQGVNYFDTAYAYPGSEELLGKALSGGYRESVTVATKCPMYKIKGREDYTVIFEEQLERLQTDYIDVYIFHCIDRPNWELVKRSGGLDFMEEQKKQGKIKAIGFSFHSDYELFKEIIEYYPWDMCLIQLNILDQNHQAGLKGLRYATQKDISVVIMEPLKGGLFRENVPEEVNKLLHSHAEQRSLIEWAFRFLYHHEDIKIILSGVSSMEQLQDNLRIFEDAVPGVMKSEDMDLINQIKDIYASKIKVGCTGCAYCMPCPAGVNIPEIFKVYNDSFLSSWTEFGKTFYSLVAVNDGKDASKCLKCGKCEKRCPQNISIIANLQEAHAHMI